MPSWLNSFTQHHPIFALPSLEDPTSLPRPKSPSLSSPFSKPFLGGSKSNKLNSSQQQQVSGYRSQNSILKETSSVNDGRRKERVVLVRGVDLIVAVGKELRISNLVDIKGRSDETTLEEEEGLESELELGEYKTLSTPIIDFEIRQLVLNATSKLLAVVGVHSIAVIVLPRKGWASTVGHTVECRSSLIGKFYHSLPASPAVADLAWHPWGANSSSLLVLTTDSNLREYSIGEDADEPSQTIRFVKEVDSGKIKGFSSDDSDAGVAVSFCLGQGESDWGPLTVYGLMKNGDVLAVCPFLPKKASVPASYIHSLSCFVSAKVDYLRTSYTESSTGEESFSALTPFQPGKISTPSNPFSQSTSSDISLSQSQNQVQPNALSRRYNQQLRYVNSLVRQVPTSTTISTIPNESTLDDPNSDSIKYVSISIPSYTSSSPALQGPFLLQPPPAELDNGAESLACDIIYINYKSSSSNLAKNRKSKAKVSEEEEEEESTKAGLGIIAIVYSDGKVEVCLEVEKVEAQWGDRESDYENEDSELIGGPSLAVYETIDLGFSNELGENVESGLEGNYPIFVKDPLYPDTVYIYHALGAHCLSFSRWIESVTSLGTSDNDLGGEEGDEEVLQKKMERELRAMEGSDVVWILKTLDVSNSSSSDSSTPPVVGLVMIYDVYLGYSILLVTSALQAVGIELSLRVDLTLVPSSSTTSTKPFTFSSTSTSTSKGVSSDSPAYLSLLDTPFTIPSILSNPSGVATVARRVLQKSKTSTAPLVITPDTLRFMGSTVETFRHSIRDLVGAADEVQCRLELQMKELSRQLEKLKNLKGLSEDLRKSTNASGSSSELAREVGVGGVGISSRLSKVEEAQVKLLERTDRVLQRLMEGHEPVLSAFEKKWFEELSRVEKEVLESSASVNGGISLESRAQRIIAQMESLKPALQAIKEKEVKNKQMGEGQGGSQGTPGGLGSNQMRTLEMNLAHESKLILEARQKLDRLTSLLAKSLLN